MRLDIPVGERSIVLETGKLAKQAGGSVTARLGDTMILSTATRSQAPRPGATFLPLSVDIEERMSSAGKIPGGFIKREGRPSERAILTSRLTDRPLRPLFPKNYHYEIQVIGTVLVADQDTPYDTVSMVGASAALALSDMPFDGPIGAVRVGRSLDGEFILNPTYAQIAESDLDLVVAGTKEAITMVEAGANEVPENVMVEALQVAQEVVKAQAEAIEEWALEHGKEKQEIEDTEENPFLADFRERYFGRMKEGIVQTDRRARHDVLEELREELIEGREEEEIPLITSALSTLEKEAFRALYIEDRKRTDLRGLDEIRPTSAEVGVLPRVHGTGLFTRGETQVLSSLALADPRSRAAARHHRAADGQALHAPLQLPAFLHGRDGTPGESAAERDRARRSRRAGAGTGHSIGGRVPLCSTRNIRGIRVERFLIDGERVRFDAGIDGRRRADQSPRRRCCNGAGQGGRRLCHPQ